MVFSSILFLFVYLPVVLAVYYIVPARYRNLWLFIVNLVFYGWGEPVYILLMVFSIALNYAAGLLIARYRLTDDKKARAVLTVNTVVNLALLIFFKYFDLLAATLSRIPGISIPALGLTLPIGISFYTFQTMSYPIDVYRGDTEEQKNFIRFGTFVALFPQLIAGPIVRYKDVASQLGTRRLSSEQFSSGVQRFAIGLGKKVLLANNIGALWDIYAAAPELSFAGAWLGALAFSLQLYFDFSGYSDMAIGLGRMLGFEFLENFNYPYISKSVTEFWRRWHMSLGTWFRDYLYIPLGGNRRGLPRQILNILIVWALTGLWHGANWTVLCGVSDSGKGFPSQKARKSAGSGTHLRAARCRRRVDALPAQLRRRGRALLGRNVRRKRRCGYGSRRILRAELCRHSFYRSHRSDTRPQKALSAHSAESTKCTHAGACRALSGDLYGISRRRDVQSVPVLPVLTEGGQN